MSAAKPRPPVDWQAVMVWVPGLLVACGAGAATAHGLFTVATATGVPGYIAWVYPLITDGLALVAYASATRLSGRARAYAWCVVVLAAGLSGLAQASYLDSDTGPAGPSSTVPNALRFGVGAWPAIAAAIVAHLLFMLAAEARAHGTVEPSKPAAPGIDNRSAVQGQPSAPAVQPTPRVQPVHDPAGVQARPVERVREPDAVQAEQRAVGAQRSTRPEVVRRVERPALESFDIAAVRAQVADAAGPRDVARAVARAYFEQHGELPTARVLVAIARVSQGTAGNALKEIREQHPALHIVHNTDEPSADQ